ncbi:hypothetical protein TNIN_148191 [Trichonephila inaurata madagascariensis]|uniref:Uncharacterized protein n=1 Tax=Trichonephila inaurata madagascariensis TaxID=2747483 RepID=A0A8X6WU90_9ARAC|nr:hypothetical protein TNIN_148191 [Trichonephila inaurata madagascariensis]
MLIFVLLFLRYVICLHDNFSLAFVNEVGLCKNFQKHSYLLDQDIQQYNLIIKDNIVIDKLKQFWKSTGLW